MYGYNIRYRAVPTGAAVVRHRGLGTSARCAQPAVAERVPRDAAVKALRYVGSGGNSSPRHRMPFDS